MEGKMGVRAWKALRAAGRKEEGMVVGLEARKGGRTEGKAGWALRETGREEPRGSGGAGCCAVHAAAAGPGGFARTWQVHVEQQWHRSGAVSHGSCGGGPQAACFNIPAPIIIIIIPLYQGAADGE